MGDTSVAIVSLDQLIHAARDRMEGNNNAEEVEEIVTAVLPQGYIKLDLNVSLNGEAEESIFNAMVSSNRVSCLNILPNVEVSSVEDMLRKAITAMPSLRDVGIAISLTEAQTERILSILRMSATLDKATLFLGHCTAEFAKTFAKYLRESSLKMLSLSWSSYRSAGPVEQVPVSQATMRIIFEGIGHSSSLKRFYVMVPPVTDDVDVVSELCASAITKCASLRSMGICTLHHAQQFFDKVEKALMCTEAVQNFDFCFYKSETRINISFKLKRKTPWKPLLSMDVPLALWPRILAKTNAWTSETSHSPLDALFFLMREKSDVLLQNVRRRKIRKRKRFQFE